MGAAPAADVRDGEENKRYYAGLSLTCPLNICQSSSNLKSMHQLPAGRPRAAISLASAQSACPLRHRLHALPALSTSRMHYPSLVRNFLARHACLCCKIFLTVELLFSLFPYNVQACY